MTFPIFLLLFQGNGLVRDISSSPHLNCVLVCVLPTVVILLNQTSSRRHSHTNKLQQLNKIPFSIPTGFPEKKIKQIELLETNPEIRKRERGVYWPLSR